MQPKFSYIAVVLSFLVLSTACSLQQNHDTRLPRVAIAGIAIESSTFSPAVTHEEAFMARYGEEVFSYYPFLDEDSALRQQAIWLPTMRGHAMPGGIVTRSL